LPCFLSFGMYFGFVHWGSHIVLMRAVARNPNCLYESLWKSRNFLGQCEKSYFLWIIGVGKSVLVVRMCMIFTRGTCGLFVVPILVVWLRNVVFGWKGHVGFGIDQFSKSTNFSGLVENSYVMISIWAWIGLFCNVSRQMVSSVMESMNFERPWRNSYFINLVIIVGTVCWYCWWLWHDNVFVQVVHAVFFVLFWKMMPTPI